MSAKASIEQNSFEEKKIPSDTELLDVQSSQSENDLTLSSSEKNAKVQELAQAYNINHKKLMWKIDLCVVPPFCLLYFLAFLDRVNISNANVYGMSKELGLSNNQFSAALTVFFVPYIVFEILSNFMLKLACQTSLMVGCDDIFIWSCYHLYGMVQKLRWLDSLQIVFRNF